ncbi:hypothetical protein LTR91_024776 [Friedmanniomyces endolithicus]|uniref:Uncharacterized protein n=1 Tax=Friedmanniomyces endolithicus TaxID=329885 RepID=A0AAN6K3F4_9PEZI|nr:hypothetical protein LTR91_024776 [Friedmanniomyces endolithicus]KAK0974414.1 hypothetical protein LTS01_014183 [Friedmanniomyces endolithicus]KAK1047403.1 hypothetical protein LTS16_005173 [Friedmanniomyces endolithicus]
MARHKRKPPQIITERPLDATTRKFLEKRDGVKNINWATQEKMDAIVAKKRKAEEEELYNSSDLRRKQQRLDVEEAARMPMLRGSADLDFDLPFSPSTSVAEANARELERAQKVRARRRAQRARKVAREYARGEVVFERALGLINDEVEKEALRLINSGDTEKAMRLVDDGKERKADEAKKLEEVKEVQDGGTGVKTMAKAEVKALKRARRTRRGSAEDARGDVVVDEMLGLISSKDADEALRVIDSVETEEALALDQGNEANASTTTQELEREEKVKKSNSTRRARQRVAHYDRENIMEGEALALSEFPEKMETPETSTDTETAQLQQRVEKAKAARKVRRASQKAARLAQEDLDWAEGFGPAAHKEMMETLAMSSETEAAEEQKWRDHEIEANRLERGKRKAAQFARGEIWWDELLGLISCREAEEALAALVEDNEAKGERLRGARRRAARYARGEVLVDDEALGLVEGEETTEERTEAGRAKRAGSL